ncbi:MAG TPA: ribosome maturation factor RimM [Bacteroidales bacterium]|nr:ribosome maturation factor RimM [Bacteroidales bacterium]
MTKGELFYFGHLSKTTGTKGVLVLVREKIDEALLIEQKALFVSLPPDYVPFMIESLEALSEERYQVHFLDVDTPGQAEKLAGQDVFIPIKNLPDGFTKSFKGVEGFMVVDDEHGKLGVIREIIENPAHELLVMEYLNNEVLIPVTESMIKGVDVEKELIFTDLPDGLLDLNKKSGETE